jgi:hypothetical protein
VLAIELNDKCCVIDCEQPATVFTEGLVLCPKHYLEMDREHKKLIFEVYIQPS